MTLVTTDQHDPRTGAPSEATTREVRVLDTSALIAEPDVLFAFPGCDVVIPLTVVEELDGLKTRRDDNVGAMARRVLRKLEQVRDGGPLHEPIALRHGGTLRVELNHARFDKLLESGLDSSKPDNRILASALGQADRAKTTVVSADTAMRVKASALGLEAVEHAAARQLDDSEVGWRRVPVDRALIDQLYLDRVIPDEGILDAAVTDQEVNQGLLLSAGMQSALGRRCEGGLLLLRKDQSAWGLLPKNAEQRFALDLLMDPEVGVVALDGPSGCGKTILAVAAGLEQAVEPGDQQHYSRVSVYRPTITVGRQDVGFLPGTLDEKLAPWMEPIMDALAALSERKSKGAAKQMVEQLRGTGQLTFESIGYLRGRSIGGTYMIVDEAQNLEPATLKAMLTRVAEGTKIVFTGDTSQIDNAFTSADSNALTVLLQAFHGQACFGHVRLTSCVRSEISELATRLL
ncbi:PhoH family protein [Acidiferrimicrobium sp. IK]|uniref:PhoH family protein n=1 Tax=Acidiferrimicrobium sp. IK TaxID=2871700 RepID=UPI0021CB1636|nr:PhoH family protein [Acidiferrimicrobium sp. IK]MCU4185274.1 PhoH family protein [Acidiferrimicrobium sp. IK]